VEDIVQETWCRVVGRIRSRGIAPAFWDDLTWGVAVRCLLEANRRCRSLRNRELAAATDLAEVQAGLTHDALEHSDNLVLVRDWLVAGVGELRARLAIGVWLEDLSWRQSGASLGLDAQQSEAARRQILRFLSDHAAIQSLRVRLDVEVDTLARRVQSPESRVRQRNQVEVHMMSLFLSGAQGFVLVVGIFVLPSVVASPLPLANTCSGVGLSGDKHWISCNVSGTCATGTCKVGSGSDAEGAFKFCGCGATSPTEPDCCHLVARQSEDGTVYLDVRGLCTTSNPKCAESDGRTCQLVNDQPVCAAGS
jgi:DNA-directed RNA polymerase specialized sigma24 family protein